MAKKRKMTVLELKDFTVGWKPFTPTFVEVNPDMLKRLRKVEAAANSAHLHTARWCLEQAVVLEDRDESDCYRVIAAKLLRECEEEEDENGTHESNT